jgi:hypothetical protein
LEESEDEEFITFRGEESPEEIREVPKVEPSQIITRSRALLDVLEESSSSSEDEGKEWNFMAANFDIGDPQTFKEAYYHPDKGKGIKKEISSMEQRGVWKVIDRKSIPEGRKLIGNM